MTLPPDSEPGGHARRLAQFRNELSRLAHSPSRASLEKIRLRANELGLDPRDVGDDLSDINACLEALDVGRQLAQGELPVVDCLEPLPPGDTCHFVSPVRFGRRRADQFGHLLLTSGWLKFRGAVDVSVAWGEIGSARRDGRDFVVALHDSRRVLRFSCHSHTEAAVGAVIAEHLARVARSEAVGPPALHASV